MSKYHNHASKRSWALAIIEFEATLDETDLFCFFIDPLVKPECVCRSCEQCHNSSLWILSLSPALLYPFVNNNSCVHQCVSERSHGS